MCGIVGYVGPRDAVSIILNGLKRLEYRGYDSAGVAVINSNQIEVRRDAGKLSQLVDLVGKSPLRARRALVTRAGQRMARRLRAMRIRIWEVQDAWWWCITASWKISSRSRMN